MGGVRELCVIDNGPELVLLGREHGLDRIEPRAQITTPPTQSSHSPGESVTLGTRASFYAKVFHPFCIPSTIDPVVGNTPPNDAVLGKEHF